MSRKLYDELVRITADAQKTKWDAFLAACDAAKKEMGIEDWDDYDELQWEIGDDVGSAWRKALPAESQSLDGTTTPRLTDAHEYNSIAHCRQAYVLVWTESGPDSDPEIALMPRCPSCGDGWIEEGLGDAGLDAQCGTTPLFPPYEYYFPTPPECECCAQELEDIRIDIEDHNAAIVALEFKLKQWPRHEWWKPTKEKDR